MAKRKARRNSQTEKFWSDHIAAKEASGLSQAAYCTREGLNPNTFSSWKTVLLKRKSEQAQEVQQAIRKASVNRAARAEKASFIPLVPTNSKVTQPASTNPPRASAVAEVEVAGARLRIFNGADCGTLCAIIRAMRESEHAR